jgi:DeoR/GlpR family transcriptional regulator of sugar metabolism
MLGVERRLKIMERIADDPTVEVGELAVSFGVSEMTVRRDFARLERDGFLRRTHGGATIHLTRSIDLALNARLLRRAVEKRSVAMAAVPLVAGVRALYLGIGSTAEQFARYLPDDPDLTVVTGSLPIASLLGTRNLRAVALGGTLLRDELSFIGPAAAATLERYRFDAAVVGAAGISGRDGLTEGTEEEAEINRRAVQLAKRTIVIADGTKVGATAIAAVVPASGIDTVVTDASAPPAEVEALRAEGVRVIVVGPAASSPAGATDYPRPDDAGSRRENSTP